LSPVIVNQSFKNDESTAIGKRLAASAVATFVEVGPGRVLTGLLKRTLDGVRGHNVDDPASLEKAVGAVRGGAA